MKKIRHCINLLVMASILGADSGEFDKKPTEHKKKELPAKDPHPPH